MKKSNLGNKVLSDLEKLITLSCSSPRLFKKFEHLHIALLKKYYNAVDVSIDYHRHRIEMNIVLDDKAYKAGKVNTYLPTLHTNLLFDNLRRFLKSCVDKDHKSLGFYAKLLNTFNTKEKSYSLA
ncbi:hypothetical protein [Maribacter sp. 2210JD10-5]|uniref:hypothetical protein n=1 Tax=Maribacter sp. 2210JD10-5 TaxID=3386272 RepID=UPI0039BCBBEF